jgi:hypothetical protein
MELAVHEKLLLLVLDDEKGNSRAAYTELVLAGALLVDLVRAGAVEVAGGDLRPGTLRPSGILGDAMAAIEDETRARSLRWWVQHLPGRLKPFVPRLAERLVGAGVLAVEEHKLLGLFARTRLPERDHGPEGEIVQRLQAVLVDGRQPQGDDAVLAALVGATPLLDRLVARPDRKRARLRAEQLGEADEVNVAVRAAVKAARDAAAAAVIASTVATTAATT